MPLESVNFQVDADMSNTSCVKVSKPSVSSEKLHAAMLVGLLAVMVGMLIVRQDHLFVSATQPVPIDYKSNPTALIAKIQSKYLLTQTDAPIVVMVTEQEKLRASTPFFAAVNNGDVIAYFKDEVFVYRPSTDTIVKHGPVVSNAGSQPTAKTETDARSTEVKSDRSTNVVENKETPAEPEVKKNSVQE